MTDATNIKKTFKVTPKEYNQINAQLDSIKSILHTGPPENGQQSPINPWLVSVALGNIIDPRFKLIRERKILAPADYNHDNQLSTLPKYFIRFNGDITDKNFKNTSYKFQANQEYIVKLFLVNNKEYIDLSDCFGLLKRNNAVFASAQGLSLLYQEISERDFYPLNLSIISLDKEESLFKDSEGEYRIPELFRNPYGVDFDLSFFNRRRYGKERITSACLACFCET